MSDQNDKEINVEKVVGYLNHTFAQVTKDFGQGMRIKNPDSGKFETTLAYDYQVDFCYLIDEIQRGPKCLIPKVIAEANTLIKRASNEKGA